MKCQINICGGIVDYEHSAIGGHRFAFLPSHGQQRAVEALVTIIDGVVFVSIFKTVGCSHLF